MSTHLVRQLLTQERAESFTHIHLIDNCLDYDRPVRPVFASHQRHLKSLILVCTLMPETLIAPQLQHLTFICYPYDHQPQSGVSSHHLREILSSTVNLQSLALGVRSVSFGVRIEPILLQHLRQLTLFFDTEEVTTLELSNVLDMVSIPALQVLELIAEREILDCEDIMLTCDAFWKDGQPRYPTVTTAVLYYPIYHCIDPERWMGAIPNVKRLITYTGALYGLTSALQPPDSQPSPIQWQKLECIRLLVDFGRFKTYGVSKLCKWLDYRQEQGLPRLKAEVVVEDTGYRGRLDALSGRCLLTVMNRCEETDYPWRYDEIRQLE